MSSPFSRTFRSLESESQARSHVMLVGGVVLLVAWGAWFTKARLAVYVSAETAQLDVMRAIHPVDAPVSGRVVEMNLPLDHEVHEGDVLVVLDAESHRLELAEANAKAAGIAPQLEATRATLKAEARALDDLAQQSRSALLEGAAKVHEAEVAATLAKGEAERLEGLRAHGAVSEIEAVRARASSEEKAAQLGALKANLARLEQEFQTNRDDRKTRLSALERDTARLEADFGALRAGIATISHDIERRVIRAPADGKIGEIGAFRLGSVVREGDRIATVVGPGTPRVVAELAPASAFGRVKEGQPARVRLDGFPWTEFGDVTARVTEVASEVRGGHARVELTVLEHSPRIPLQHGMPATVEIEVEQASPIQLVLRAAGHALHMAGDEKAPPPGTPAGAK